MTDREFNVPKPGEGRTASQVREEMAEHALREARAKAEKERALDAEKRKEYEDFMRRHFTEEDRLHYNRLAQKAVDAGLYELELVRFPASYLEDHGRRINNGESDWREHLCGYAKSLSDAFELLNEGRGFRLIARVLGYPGGMIGDIGLYISWES
ncbi:hypothetical protein NUH88_03005 [Nisaea acidiphila]|uniref:Uncharacterized protein n=1 Tax=Nisaea acidiphila TaxID=1862145 RepID=A0A9J7ATP2_9PROT|nr:hypothetical protein [Nisaea acidiphila]UUX50671.1 hypothetical protein NUH88_03005 [Nisaea acidiphila]